MLGMELRRWMIGTRRRLQAQLSSEAAPRDRKRRSQIAPLRTPKSSQYLVRPRRMIRFSKMVVADSVETLTKVNETT
jgi:hypothetical protein